MSVRMMPICLNRILMMHVFLCRRKDLISTCNNTNKAEFKMKLEAFARMVCLNWNFCNKIRIFIVTCFKPKSKFKLRNKDVAIPLYLSSLEVSLWKSKFEKKKKSTILLEMNKILNIIIELIKIFWLKVLIRGQWL